jgi:uncharacterized protein (TIGR03437 family)
MPLLAAGQSGPEISSGSVVNAANYGPLIAPGGIMSIFGTGLGQTQSLQTLPYPTKMGETSVTVNGETAPLLFVSPTLVNALVPTGIAPGPASVVVTVSGSSTKPATVQIIRVAPTFFTTGATGKGNVAAQHLDYSEITHSSPAQAGEVIVTYATGLGPVDKNGVSETPEVSIGGRKASVIYAGQTIYPGLYQINLQVPEIASGDQEIVMRMPLQRISSSEGTTVPIFGAALTGTQVAVAPEFYGLHIDSATINGKSGVPWPAFPFGGVRIFNSGTRWADINKVNGVYDFSSLDQLISNLLTQGKTDLIFTIWGTPEWASGGKTCNTASGVDSVCAPPSDLNPDGSGPDQYWKNFVAALASHVAGQVPGRIKYWEIWNEPNNPNYWTGTVAQLVTMARDAYTIIKQFDPQAVILTPPVAGGAVADSGGGWNWLRGYFQAGGDRWTDIVAFHGYPNPQEQPVSPEAVLGGIAKIASISPAGKRRWNTESSWGNNTVLPDLDLQEAFAARSHLVQIGVVDRYYWFQYGNPDVGTLTDSANQLTPAGVALGEVYNWTVGAIFAAPCAPVSQGSTTWSCQIERSGGYQAFAVWDTSLTCSGGTCPTIPYTPPDGMISYRDLGGNIYPITPTIPVPIGAKPILLANQWEGPSPVVLSPGALSFGKQVYQKPSTAQTFTLTNFTTTPLNITAIAVTGTDPGDFTQTNTCGTAVESNASCTITVIFTPAGIGVRSASITITDNAAGSPRTVPLLGTGITAITASPASLTFPSANVGTTIVQAVTITNSSTVAIPVISFTISGANASDFAQTNTCGSSLAGGASCDVNVTFTPAAGGTRSAALSIAHGDPASPLTVALSGTGSSGAAVILSPSSLAFGSVIYLQPSKPLPVALTNSGAAALNIKSVSITGTNAEDFTQINNCGTSVAAGASCTLAVTFTPHRIGASTAALNITDASGSTHSVLLTGRGIRLLVLLDSLTFPSTPLNTKSLPRTVAVTNTTSAPIEIGSITIVGANSGDFTQTNDCGTLLNSGASCTITVTFTPAAEGPRHATLNIADGDPANPQTVALSGVGSRAPVDETQEKAVIFVDPSGSDSNPGTQGSPLKTISAAASVAITNNTAGTGTRVIINPGTYREAINITAAPNQTASPITFQAATNGTVFISGAVPYTNWAADNATHGAYTSPWPYKWGFCSPDGGGAPLEQPIVMRREMVFVNGAQMTQVLSLTQMVTPGTFYVDETAGLLHVYPPPGTNMATADVEVSVLPEVLTISAPGAGSINGLVFRGLTFQYASSCRTGDAAVVVSGKVSSLLFDTDQFIWNNSEGLALNNPVATVTVLNSTANHNGATGFQAYRGKSVFWHIVEASYNNWRGAQGAYYYWNTGGMHIFSDHADDITSAKLVYNQTKALHWDTDNENHTVDSLFAAQNVAGLLNEKNQGPITITNSTFCSSVANTAGYAGFIMRNSNNTSVSASTFYNNNGGQVLVTGQAGGIPTGNWETGATYNQITQNFSFNNNVVVGTGTQAVLKHVLGGSDWNSFATTLGSNNNTWWNADNSSPFVVPVPATGTTATLAQWQSLTGQDNASVFAAPAADPSSTCSVTADIPDLWLLVDNGVVTADPSGAAVFNLQTMGLGGFNGPVTLSLDGISSIPGGSAALSSSTLSANANAVLTIQTSKTTPQGTYTFTVIANSGAITRTVTLSVVVPVNQIWITTNSLTFLNQAVNFTSPAQTVTLSNLSSSALPISSVTVAAGFAQTNNCGTKLAAGASCAINVTFSPKTLKTYSGNLNINYGSPSTTQAISLTGTTAGSGQVQFSVTSLSFGLQVYLKPSANQNVTMTNNGTGLMNINSIAVTGANANDFTQTNTCGPTLDVNQSCTISVSFSPIALGQRAASVTVTDDAAGSPQSFTLAGNGITAISYTPKTLTAFSTTGISSTSTGKTITITNLSTAQLGITGILFSGANPADFTETDSCGQALAGGASCTVTVQFAPQAAGSRAASLSINNADPSSPQVISVSGTGTAISVSPKALAFGSSKVGKAVSKTVTVTNLGSAPVAVSAIAVGGTNAADFTQTNNCGKSIAGATSCTITVTFTPAATGSRTGTVTITDADPTSPQSVTLTGTGS